MINLDSFSAPAKTAVMAELKRRDGANLPDPTDDEVAAIVKEADRVATYGVGYKTDRNGNPIQQGIGSPGHESINHFNSIRHYEGEEAYNRAVREIYKRDPQRAKALGLPEPQRAGA